MKRKTTYIIFCLVWFSSLSSQCEMDKSFVIDLINESGHAIGYHFATEEPYYPDTSLPKTNKYVMYDISKVLRPGYESHLEWERYFPYFQKIPCLFSFSIQILLTNTHGKKSEINI